MHCLGLNTHLQRLAFSYSIFFFFLLYYYFFVCLFAWLALCPNSEEFIDKEDLDLMICIKSQGGHNCSTKCLV